MKNLNILYIILLVILTGCSYSDDSMSTYEITGFGKINTPSYLNQMSIDTLGELPMIKYNFYSDNNSYNIKKWNWTDGFEHKDSLSLLFQIIVEKTDHKMMSPEDFLKSYSNRLSSLYGNNLSWIKKEMIGSNDNSIFEFYFTVNPVKNLTRIEYKKVEINYMDSLVIELDFVAHNIRDNGDIEKYKLDAEKTINEVDISKFNIQKLKDY